MAFYMVQVAYTSEAWAALVKNPQNRIEAVRPAVERAGGRVHSAWFAFGKYDIVAIFEMPDNVAQAAISIAFAAGGAVKALKTTALMTIEEGIAAMKKAGGTGYKPPG